MWFESCSDARLEPMPRAATVTAMNALPTTPIETAIGPEQDDWRLDRALAMLIPSLSRSRLQSLIRSGAVSLAGQTIGDPGRRVKAGDAFKLEIPAPAAAEPAGEPIALAVAYEDDDLIVIDKPAGLVVHPAAGHASGTLVNALIAHCGASLSGIGGVRRPGIVHRLDKDTSGLLVVAKTDAAHKSLAAQFASHGVDGRLERRYLALVWGTPLRQHGQVEAALARSRTNRLRIAVTEGPAGRRALTHFEVNERFQVADGSTVASLMSLTLETGRTHQIRVHMAHIGHPVMGDPVYGSGFQTSASRLPPDAQAALVALGRQALHAAHLAFEHPVTGQRLAFDSALPSDMMKLLVTLRPKAGLARRHEGKKRLRRI